MKRINSPPLHESPSQTRYLSLREFLLLVITIAALLLPNVLHQPQPKTPFTDRTDITTLSNTSSCTTTEEIATIIISCGSGETDAVGEMRPLLTSIILLTSIPLRFVFITDDDGIVRIQKMFTELGRTQRPIVVRTVKLSSEWMEEWTGKTNLDMYAHHSGMYGMSKLAAPWLLPDINMGVVLDTDMVLLKDPALLWSDALREEGEGFQKGWVYRMMLSSDMEKASQMCSCVMAMRLKQARDENVYPQVVGKALKEFPVWFRQGIIKPPHGDQGVFYALWQHNHRLVGHLDTIWNRDHCHKFNGIFDDRDKKNAGILHRNCYGENDPKRNQTNDGSPPFFDFYDKYPWRWLRAPEGQGCDVIVEGAQ